MLKRLLPLVVLLAFVGGASAAAPVASGTIEGPFGDVRLGGVVTFETEVDGLKGWQYPMIAVWCYQDLNGDGIKYFPNDGGDLVYMWLDSPDASFPLGAASSKWVDLGGAADCQAILYAYGDRGNTQTIDTLDATGFFEAVG
jgi:hypothetical protein